MSSNTSTGRRTRPQDKANKTDKFKLLREAKRNRNRAALYEEEEQEIYKEIDEEDYHAINDDENFVEDDDNAGYIDNGYNDEQAFSDEYEEQEMTRHGKRKRKDKKTKQAKPENQINQFFRKSTMDRKPNPSSSLNTAEDQDFMANLLSSLETDPATELSSKAQVKSRPSPMRSYEDKVGYKSVGFAKRPTSTFTEKRYEPTVPVNVPVKETKVNTVTEVMNEEVLPKESSDFDIHEPEMDDVVMDEPETVTKHEEEMDVQATLMAEESWNDILRDDLENSKISEQEQKNVHQDNQGNTDVLEDDGSLRMWWYDMFERREKGYLYIFGKVLKKSSQRFVSCCVVVKNIERNIFVLPRQFKLDASGNPTEEEVEIGDVYSEISGLCSKLGVRKWGSKSVTRKYAFELSDVPAEAEYLKVVYDYEQPPFPADIKGSTFSRIFGTNTGPLEHFLVKRKIMGPCWLEIRDATFSNTNETWCKVQISVEDPKLCNPLQNPPSSIPPLVVMSLSLRTVMNSQKNTNEVIAASAMVCNQVQIDQPTPVEEQTKTRFTVVRQLTDVPYPAGFNDAVAKERQQNGFAIHVERTESSLLNFLIAKMHTCDPDVIVGHNFAGFDLDVLLHRMKALNTQNWHKLGRLKRKNWPKLQAGAGGSGDSTYQERMIMSGRLVCDTYLAAKDLIRSKSYRMTDLAQSQLKVNREDIDFSKTAEQYNEARSLVHLVKHCAFDAYLAMALMFKLQILPLTRQLTNLAGNLWSRTMTGARAERNEFLLLHEFHRQKFICPDKSFPTKGRAAVIEAVEFDQDEDAEQLRPKKAGSSRRKPAYAGGLVLEPKKGFYDKYVLLLDFNSLYPSIIQEYNVCFTTVERHNLVVDEAEGTPDEKVPDVPGQDKEQGLLPRLLKALVDRRRQVKGLMKDPKLSEAQMMQYDIRQKALKLTANSMYGCLGFSHSRFYAKPLAMLITHKGREILQNTVELAGSMDLNVIYGDTDSIMVYTNQDDIKKVKEMGLELKKQVNERYKLLEIDIDGFFKHMLLLKKKKYAALLVEEAPNGKLIETVETKGLDLVRRDWCDLSHDVSMHVLKLILSDKDREEVIEEIHKYLRETGEEIRRGGVKLEQYVINKQLTKKPEEYADAKNQPHVQVAIRMRKSGQNVRAGDTIPYVICQVDHIPNGAKTGFAEKAFHPDDVKRGTMQLDIEWYLNQQIHPPVARLCSPMDGTDPARIAECLGLDPNKYSSGIRSNPDDQDQFTTLESQISDKERFKDVDRLILKCNHCQDENLIEGITREINETTVQCTLQCNACQKTMDFFSVRMQLVAMIRSVIRRYYHGWLICEDDTCGQRTRMMSVFGRRCLSEGCHGAMKREYTDKNLYTQLLYFTFIFDATKAKAKSQGTAHALQVESIGNKYHHEFASLKAVAEQYLERSGYRHVDIGKLMAGISYA
ncbi:DNA-directed DNA polymerase alpha catalytic subunit pol1 [Apophysomyces ossiformis]|uniref:DNA polymerase n=1 Tax=Apophysomyces ossiformis TaxID=679940 RepID=A0A8H7EPK2_9FUNG|nr:DNA-directed DNA polymerase alpha catalytic subunit pol1 [Apophysomyces ossiformis]